MIEDISVNELRIITKHKTIEKILPVGVMKDISKNELRVTTQHTNIEHLLQVRKSCKHAVLLPRNVSVSSNKIILVTGIRRGPNYEKSLPQ